MRLYNPILPLMSESARIKPTDRFLRIAEVSRMVALSKPAIYTAMRRGHFPQGRRVGPKAVRWLESDILAFMADCPPVGGASNQRE